MKTLIELLGGIMILLAIIHIIFPRVFNWKKELASLSLINRQLMTVHTFFIALGVLLMGILCCTSASELLTTPIGKKVLLGMAIFWGARTLTQLFWYSSELWKGKLFETSVHILFLLLWISMTTVFTIGAIH